METFWTIVGIIIALAFVFCWGYIAGSVYEYPKIEKKQEFYCTDCQTDTIMKESKGDYYCGDCGYYHGTKF